MPEFQFIEEVDRLVNTGVIYFVISGGESLLHLFFLDVICYGWERGIMEIEIQINGVRFVKCAFVDKVVDVGFMVVCVLLHSSDSVEFDWIMK